MKVPWKNLGLGGIASQLADTVPYFGDADGSSDVNTIRGLEKLVSRQMPQFAEQIQFDLDHIINENSGHDQYSVTQDPETGKILVSGASKSALASGLYRYLQDVGNVSISWTDSGLKSLESLPSLCNEETKECEVLEGSSVVPYRYHFNTVTFGYTTPHFTWEDWEHLLDWAALHGINAPLAWSGYEQVLIEVLKDFGFSEKHLEGFLSGQDFLPWNRFGNVQGSWNSTFDFKLAKRQLDLQKKIVSRMVDLGMTPILPAFTGFVPREIRDVYPDANVVNSSCWNGFPTLNSNVTFLEPLDPLFYDLQKAFLEKQQSHLGHGITHMYTLDQYNENTPFSGDLEYLKDVSAGTIKTLKTVDPDATWVMQGWLFYYERDFWTDERVEAYLSGVSKGDLLILDLFSDHCPQWERTKSYYGHNWVWCELHDFGGNMGLEGSMQVLTQNFTHAREQNPTNLVGVGLTPESQEGNQIVYDIMLAQAWSEIPLDLNEYTKKHVQARYGPSPVPDAIIDIWQRLVGVVYTNDQSTGVYAVSKSMFEEQPALNGIADKPGIQPTRLAYEPARLEALWEELVNWILTDDNSAWLKDSHFHHDVVDITRQVVANRFLPEYLEFVALYAKGATKDSLLDQGDKMLSVLYQLDEVLYTNKDFCLGEWISSAKKLSKGSKEQAINEFQARNQLTLWGPYGEINDYASKQWAGLVGDYYAGRWQRFISFIANRQEQKGFTPKFIQNYAQLWNGFKSMLGLGGYAIDPQADVEFKTIADTFETNWQWESWGSSPDQSWSSKGELVDVLKKLLVK